MNYDQPRQVKGGRADGKFHYTRMREGHVYPIGPCRDNDCPGHDTPDGACEHYKIGLIAKAKFIPMGDDEYPKYKCEVAGCCEEAKWIARIPDWARQYQLCRAHANRDGLLLVIQVGESWHG